jgi:hypothetical protein
VRTGSSAASRSCRISGGAKILCPRPSAGPAQCIDGIPTAVYSDFRYSVSSVFSGSVSPSLKNWS